MANTSFVEERTTPAMLAGVSPFQSGPEAIAEVTARLRTQLALLLERVTLDPVTREVKIVYRLSPKQGSSERPHGYPLHTPLGRRPYEPLATGGSAS